MPSIRDLMGVIRQSKRRMCDLKEYLDYLDFLDIFTILVYGNYFLLFLQMKYEFYFFTFFFLSGNTFFKSAKMSK
jgi:hypothetical protein